MIYAYPCVLTPAEDGSLIATFPDVPEAITGGADRSEALALAEDALATALAGYVNAKWDIPVPSEAVAGRELVAVPTVVAAKLALYAAMREQRITNVELARRLGISESAVRKLANPDHRSHVGQVQKALRAVGRSLRVEGHRRLKPSRDMTVLRVAVRSLRPRHSYLSQATQTRPASRLHVTPVESTDARQNPGRCVICRSQLCHNR